ncbi:MAG TPA: tetratricopeptide repeat protein [Bradyrhizobium sp.]|nr:tetratricopeptide repeat protein [Bradyrhizobium sp.]
MAELKVKPPLRPEAQPATATVLQDSFLRVQQAEALRLHGRFDQAQAICESLLRSNPDYVAALHTLGLVLADQERHRDALSYLVRAVMLNPLGWTALTALAGVYLRLGAIEMAAQTIEQAIAIEPGDAGVHLMLGDIRREQCEYEIARDAYRRALTIDPGMVEAEIGMGWCCAEIGDFAKAVEAFEGAAGRNPRLIEPLRALAAFPAGEVRINLLAQLERMARDRRDDDAEFQISAAFIRSAALDRAGRHAEAWKCVGDANRTMLRGMTSSLKQLAENRRTSLATLREQKETSERREPSGGEIPISLFILGPSRSGKSTMEKLVSGLAGVKRGYENPIVELAVRRTFQLSALPTDSRLSQLPPPAHPLCRRIYLLELTRRTGQARIFTNTNSAGIFEAASIATVFDRTRFILVKRKLDDNLLRIYLRKYGEANAYAYDLKTAREHIQWYHQMIDLMAAKFPNIVRIVHYEDMVADPDLALRMAADLCEASVHDGHSTSITGDPDCAAPYREFISAELDD